MTLALLQYIIKQVSSSWSTFIQVKTGYFDCLISYSIEESLIRYKTIIVFLLCANIKT